MNQYILLIGIVLIICILLHQFAERLPVPSLLIFIGLGICFGVDGLLGISFSDYKASETICSIALIFIMFYGGFGTNLQSARPVIVKSLLLSTAGVILTAGFTGAFVHFILHLSWTESVLIGSVIASTDAASVFNILRSQNLALKDNTASLLEMESGSNDPVSYMLTIVITALMLGKDVSISGLLFKQISWGVFGGLLIGCAAVMLLRRLDFYIEQGRTIFVFAIALTAFALPTVLGGNGYLSVYLCGILMGNQYIPDKKQLVHFFDTITGIAQMIIFFLLGLLVTPSELFPVLIPALLIMVFLTVIGRPLAVALILTPCRSSLRQMGVVSWAGLRGVASIVFSIYVVLNEVPVTYNLFNLVFCIVLMSIAIQGTLLPWFSEKTRMIDENADIRKTFNDYQDSGDANFIKMHIDETHHLAGKLLKDAVLPQEFLVVLILRQEETVIPKGDTRILPGDLLIIAAPAFEDQKNLALYETCIRKGHHWMNRKIQDITLPKGYLIVLIMRGNETIIPGGDTKICENDTLVTARF